MNLSAFSCVLKPPASRSLLCPYCSKPYPDQSSYDTHIRTHTGQSVSYICPQCKEGVPTMEEFKKHVGTHSKEELLAEVRRGRKGGDEGRAREIKCFLCGTQLNRETFFSHMSNHSKAISEQCIETREKLSAYLLTLEFADRALKDVVWTSK